MSPDLRIRSFREGKYGMINRLPAIGRFIVISYRFENKKFIATDNDAGSLYCVSKATKMPAMIYCNILKKRSILRS